MSPLLDGRRAVVTGAAQGIGLAIAEALAAEGARVLIADLDGDRAQQAAARTSGAVGVACDVRSDADVQSAVDLAVQTFGGLDIWVNNAGVTRDASLRKMTTDDFDLVLAVHLRGAWLGVRAASAVMRTAGGGSIVNISSVSGKIGNPGQTNYSAAKAGIVGLTKAAAKELARHQVRVNAVQPGLIRTPMTEAMTPEAFAATEATIPMQRAGDPSEVAGAVVFLASPLASYVTGTVLEVSGGRGDVRVEPTGRHADRPVLIDDDGPVRVLTLNRPQARNAIDMAARTELAAAFEQVAASRDRVRAVVLAGAGPVFCAGGDVTTMRRMAEPEARQRAEAAQRVARAVWACPQPVLAAVEGGAHGAGLSLALACDRLVAGEGATFSAAFTGVGLAGDLGIFATLPARVGVAAARQMLLMSTTTPAHDALAVGLVDRVVPSGGALAAALEEAHRLARGPAAALAGVKALLATTGASREEVLDAELELQVRLFGGEDFAEGVAAFRERRRPRFGTAPAGSGRP